MAIVTYGKSIMSSVIMANETEPLVGWLVGLLVGLLIG